MKIDKTIMIVPLVLIVTLSVLFATFPEASLNILESIRNFLGNYFGLFYLFFGLACFITTFYMAFSYRGKTKLGTSEKPAYNNLTWGAMIFTSTMAADIIFFSLIEWTFYANEPHVQGLGNLELWSATMPLFHWGPIVWSFYIVLAVAIGYLLHVKGVTNQKFSEMARPIIGGKADGTLGRIIDVIVVFGLLAGTATTFSLATPLISAATSYLFNIENNTVLTIMILIGVATIYTAVALIGMKGIEKLSKISVVFFISLLSYFLFLGGEVRFILEMGVSAIGNMVQNFVFLSTWTDPLRGDYFPQNWTVFYWAYWVSWSVATPFFIAAISKGRTIKNTVLGTYLFGILGTFTSFIILGGYGMAQGFEIASLTGYVDESSIIISIFQNLPLHVIAVVLLVITMILFYATTFDSLTLVISKFSYKDLKEGEEPSKLVRAFWSIVFIILPIGLILSEGALYSLQSLAIIVAFPISFIIMLVVGGFLKKQ